jgi:hypothetical protein
MFNLIHRAMQGEFSIDREDIWTSQQNNLDAATSSFLKQRKQLLQAQPQLGATTQATQSAPTTPVITPQSLQSSEYSPHLGPDALPAQPETSTPKACCL